MILFNAGFIFFFGTARLTDHINHFAWIYFLENIAKIVWFTVQLWQEVRLQFIEKLTLSLWCGKIFAYQQPLSWNWVIYFWQSECNFPRNQKSFNAWDQICVIPLRCLMPDGPLLPQIYWMHLQSLFWDIRTPSENADFMRDVIWVARRL